MSTCEHCGEPVIEALMRRTGRTILLDPTTRAIGNIHLIEPGSLAEFIPAERRVFDPKKPDAFIPPEKRYQSHRATCTQNERTCSQDTRDFIADVDRRLADR